MTSKMPTTLVLSILILVGMPALCVETIGTDGQPVVQWLKHGTPHILPAALGPMTIVLGPRANREAGGHQ